MLCGSHLASSVRVFGVMMAPMTWTVWEPSTVMRVQVPTFVSLYTKYYYFFNFGAQRNKTRPERDLIGSRRFSAALIGRACCFRPPLMFLLTSAKFQPSAKIRFISPCPFDLIHRQKPCAAQRKANETGRTERSKSSCSRPRQRSENKPQTFSRFVWVPATPLMKGGALCDVQAALETGGRRSRDRLG